MPAGTSNQWPRTRSHKTAWREGNVKDQLVHTLTAAQQKQSLWEEFLAQLSTPGGPSVDSLEPLLRSLGEEEVCTGLKRAADAVPGASEAELLRLALRASGRIRRELEEEANRLRDTLRDLATPMVRIWKDVLLVPLIGSLDSVRAETLAERLLEAASASRAKVVIVDVTGLPTIDTAVGGFLIEMFAALRLLGTSVVLTGIRPSVAHTLVKLGIDFRMVGIARDLEDALRMSLELVAGEEAQNKKHSGLPWNTAGEGNHDAAG